MKSESGASASKEKEGGDRKNKSYNFSKGSNRVLSIATKFEGKVDALKGFYYDCSDTKQSDMFAKTTKEIAGYVGRTYKFGGDTRIAVENGEAPIFDLPPDPPAGSSRGVEKLWEKELDDVAKRRTQLGHNLRQLFALVWGQCTEVLQQRLEAEEEFANMSSTNDGLLLIKAIKNINYHHQSQKYIPHSIFEAKKRFYTQFQGAKMSTNDYFNQFMNTVDVISHSGGSVWNDKGVETVVLSDMNEQDKAKMSAAQLKNLAEEVEQRTLAVAFIRGSDRHRFGKLIEDMENSFLQGTNKYPKDSHRSPSSCLANWKSMTLKSWSSRMSEVAK